jgi:thiol-disulfide isomerase/thioredoxin
MARPVTVLLNRGNREDAFQANLIGIAAQMSGVTMNRIRLEEWRSDSFSDKPSLTLSWNDHRNVTYLAAPEGRELEPFLEGLMLFAGAKDHPKSDALEALKSLAEPVRILVLMAEECPHCPQVVRAALVLAAAQPLINVTIVDAPHFSDLAERYKIKSTPTVIFNEGFTVVGRITVEELARHALKAGDTESLTTVIESMIKTGRAEDAGALLCSQRRPEAVLPIYLSKEFSVRMGALVAMEEALEQDPRSLDPLVDDLILLLAQDDVALRGDTAELLGKIGNPVAIPALKMAVEDPDPDVREAAQEALESLERRSN